MLPSQGREASSILVPRSHFYSFITDTIVTKQKRSNSSFISTAIRSFLLFGGFYFIIESGIHLFGLRLSDISNVWPEPAILYANWMGRFYGSLCLLMSGLLFILQSDLEKYNKIILLTGVFSFFHGVLLVFGSVTERFDDVYRYYQSLSFYITTYNEYLILEALLLFIYGIFVIIWNFKKTA